MSSPVIYPETGESQISKNSSQKKSQKRKSSEISSSFVSRISQSKLSSQISPSQSRQNDTGVAALLQQNIQEAQIWGTDINVKNCIERFEIFIREFCTPGSEVPKYKELLEEIEETQIYSLVLDCMDLNEFDLNSYSQLISYPREIIPLIENVVNREYTKLFPDDKYFSHIQIKTCNLKNRKKMRDIDPDDIDCLIAFQAMVTRLSTVIPDIKTGFFRCSQCRHETEIQVDRGRISQPKNCLNSACKSKDSYTIIHNRCKFSDKQLVRVQETPEFIPEGETPQTVDVFCYGDLIDTIKPGDRVEITGVYRAMPTRINKLKRNIKALYRSYVDAIFFKIASKRMDDKKEISEDDLNISTEDKIKALAEDPDIYQKLVNSLAPSIWELEDVKRGILCQLFGGVEKKRKNESNFRSEINVLLCGDPGTSKSQLLQYVHKLSARGIYTSGKGSSAVGLTASVSRDPETRESVLESGALVLSDKGICCIDEFDKMSDSARSILHEAMEQQTISIAKAGIICSLNARTSILAAANPKESRYDPNLSVVDNILLPPTLLSRFDLIYLILDKPNERLDRRLAQHLVSLYCLEKDEKTTDFFDTETLSEYIALAKRTVQPVISDEAATLLIRGYLDLRKSGRFRNKKIITATPRQLESLIRISEALARMRFSDTVIEKDVEEAIRLMKVATQSAATDPKTGIINMDLISIGQSTLEKKETQLNMDRLIELIDDSVEPKSISFLLKKFNSGKNQTLNYTKFMEIIRNLESKKEIRLRKKSNDTFVERID